MIAFYISILILLGYFLHPIIKLLLFAKRSGTNAPRIYAYLHQHPLPSPLNLIFTPKFLFTRLLQLHNPFSRTLPSLQIQELHVDTKKNQGICVAQMAYQWQRIGNPFSSVHAAALVLFAETISGLAVFTAAFHESDKPKARVIVKRITVDYERKAKGPLTGQCHINLNEFDKCLRANDEKNQLETVVDILDQRTNERVCSVSVFWALSPVPDSSASSKKQK